MYKKTVPAEPKCNHPQFPHCDQRVLHAPGECDYCDKHPDWQFLRIAWGIAFTGYEPDITKKELPDPATEARGLSKLNAWGGNRPYKETECQSK